MAGGVPGPRPRGRPPGSRNARRGRRREPLVAPEGQIPIIAYRERLANQRQDHRQAARQQHYERQRGIEVDNDPDQPNEPNEDPDQEQLRVAGIEFRPNNNRIGPRISTQSGVPKAFGNEFKTRKKAFFPAALPITISVMSHSYTKLIGDVTPRLKENMYNIAGMMEFYSNGGNFTDDPYSWQLIRDRLTDTLNIDEQPELYTYFSDECIKSTPNRPQNFLIMRNPSVPRSVFLHHISSIAENINHIPTFVVKNFGRLMLTNPSEEDIEQMEDPRAVSKYEILLQSLVEDLGKCFRTELMCISCAISISNTDDAVRHVHSKHAQNCDELVFADWNERRRQRDEDEKNKLREELELLRRENSNLSEENATLNRANAQLNQQVQVLENNA